MPWALSMRALLIYRRARLVGQRRSHSIFGAHAIFERVLMFLLRVQMRLFGFEKGAVVPFHAQHAVRIGAIELDHIAGDIFEEVAIVAHDNARELRVLKQPLRARQFRRDRGGWWARRGAGRPAIERARLGNRETFAPARRTSVAVCDFKILEAGTAKRFGPCGTACSSSGTVALFEEPASSITD